MSFPAGISLHRSFVERWVYFLAETAVVAWQTSQARRHRDRCIEAMADLDRAVLRDIGAPDDLLHQAASRRQANAQRLDELRIVANYRSIDSRFW